MRLETRCLALESQLFLLVAVVFPCSSSPGPIAGRLTLTVGVRQWEKFFSHSVAGFRQLQLLVLIPQ